MNAQLLFTYQSVFPANSNQWSWIGHHVASIIYATWNFFKCRTSVVMYRLNQGPGCYVRTNFREVQMNRSSKRIHFKIPKVCFICISSPSGLATKRVINQIPRFIRLVGRCNLIFWDWYGIRKKLILESHSWLAGKASVLPYHCNSECE